MKKVLEISWGR